MSEKCTLKVTTPVQSFEVEIQLDPAGELVTAQAFSYMKDDFGNPHALTIDLSGAKDADFVNSVRNIMGQFGEAGFVMHVSQPESKEQAKEHETNRLGVVQEITVTPSDTSHTN